MRRLAAGRPVPAEHDYAAATGVPAPAVAEVDPALVSSSAATTLASAATTLASYRPGLSARCDSALSALS